MLHGRELCNKRSFRWPRWNSIAKKIQIIKAYWSPQESRDKSLTYTENLKSKWWNSVATPIGYADNDSSVAIITNECHWLTNFWCRKVRLFRKLEGHALQFLNDLSCPKIIFWATKKHVYCASSEEDWERRLFICEIVHSTLHSCFPRCVDGQIMFNWYNDI